MPFVSLLFSKTGLKVALILGLLVGVYYWHTSAVRAAQQVATQNAYAQAYQERDKEYQVEKKKYDDQIAQFNTVITNLSKQRIQSTVVVQAQQQKAATETKQVDALTDINSVADDICKRLKGCE